MEMRAQMLLKTFVWMIITLDLANAFSTKDVLPACDTMQPGHRGTSSQSSSSPYAIYLTPLDDGSYYVTVYGYNKEEFEGFFLQARDPNDRRVGVFTAVQRKGKMIDCGYENSAVQHINSNDKTQVTAQWVPGQYRGPVRFKATVVKSFDTYWKNIFSEQINV